MKQIKNDMGDTFKIKPGIILKEENGEGILFDPETCGTYFLNETAIFIWKSLAGKKSQAEILKEMLQRYDEVEEQVLTQDFDATIERLKQTGFITGN